MTGRSLYGDAFQEHLAPGSARSARRIVPLVMDLLNPASVIDVGCGTGAWLAVFKRSGVGRVVGVDVGGAHAHPELDDGDVVAHDLTTQLPMFDASFDVAVCLEVAEHLPAARADALVADLVRLAPAVLFSAAVPHQGGTGHVNEQWPEYWARRFAEHGFVAVDCIRPVVWNDPEVEFWYAQNLLLYAQPGIVAGNAALAKAAAATSPDALSRVHPALYLAKLHRPSIRTRVVTFGRGVRGGWRASG